MQIILYTTSYQECTVEDLQDWANSYGIVNVPVLALPYEELYMPDGFAWAFETDMGIPTTVHIGPDGTLLSVDEYVTNPAQWL